MECAQYREAASARLDGEAIGMSRAALDAHLDACSDCAAWLERATTLTRALRMRSADVPDLTERILTSTPMPRARRHRPEAVAVLRVVLALAGAVQLVTSLPGLAGQAMGMPMSTHAAHESAAWNLAIAVGLLVVAAAPRRSVGVLPVLATFAVILSVLSVPDVASGHVTAGRLATHVGALLGVVAMAALHRLQTPRRGSPPRVGSGTDEDRERQESPPPGRLRGVA